MPGFSFATRRSSPTRSTRSSPTPFERSRISVSAPNIATLARAGPPPPPSSLEIQLSSDTAILRGTGAETETAYLTGSVVLHLPDATAIKGVELRLLATARVSAPPCDGYASLNGLSLSLVQSSMSC